MSKLIVIHLAILLVVSLINTPVQGQGKTKTGKEIKQTIVADDLRLVNWCVTGIDEPEFNFYPYNEFVSYFQKTHETLVRSRDKYKQPKYDYKLTLVDVRYREDLPGLSGGLLNTAHLKFSSFRLREYALGIKEVLEPKKIEGLAIQINHAPLGIGMPTARFVFPEEEIVCFDCIHPQGIPIGCRRRTSYEITPPTIMVYHHKMETTDAERQRIKDFAAYLQRQTAKTNSSNITTVPFDCVAVFGPKYCDPEDNSFIEIPGGIMQGTNDEIHGTFVWYFPPCTISRAIEFIILVIHSFSQQDYEIFFLGPYELPDISGSRDQSLLAPTPFFYGFRENIICDTEEENTLLLSDSDRSSNSRITYPFDYSYNYDVCLRNSTKNESKICNLPKPSSCITPADNVYELKAEACEKICIAENPTTEVITTTVTPFFTRTTHGGINMITNFCLQPICIFIGRYYKETFNRHSFKGVKLWYWIHLIGGGMASICQYFGYFHPKWVQKTNPHVIAGNIMIMMLGICYASSWIRHKNHWATAAAEFFHGGSGYCVSGLAFWCLHTAPGVSDTALTLIYAATGLLILGYIIMEGCICLLDFKFGMRPLRRHFPTVEARFDDLPVPQRTTRIVFLFILTVLMVILTALTTIY